MFRLPLLLLCISLGFLWVAAIDDSDTQAHWDAFKEKYNKTYGSPEEEAEARDNFEKNMLDAAMHNMMDESEYDKDVHKYSDMHVDDQIEMLCGTDEPTEVRSYEYKDFSISERALPSSVNWVTAGKVSPVRDQGNCGSCWAFSAAQALESQAAIKWGSIWPLSEQQLVDCAKSYGNNGCSGGWPQNAFNYIQKEGGLVQEGDYPYKAKVETCNIPGNAYRFQIRGFQNVGPSGDEQAVANALTNYGPLTCALYVSKNFMNYGGGIFTDPDYKDQGVNHGVLLVGYGIQDGVSYWIIKNSWGTSWGEDGYMRVIKNDPDHLNHLKLCSYTSYPLY